MDGGGKEEEIRYGKGRGGMEEKERDKKSESNKTAGKIHIARISTK